jgi:hypothetical protein
MARHTRGPMIRSIPIRMALHRPGWPRGFNGPAASEAASSGGEPCHPPVP